MVSQLCPFFISWAQKGALEPFIRSKASALSLGAAGHLGAVATTCWVTGGQDLVTVRGPVQVFLQGQLGLLGQPADLHRLGPFLLQLVRGYPLVVNSERKRINMSEN